MIQPYYDQGGITIYCGDCRLILPQLDVKVDLVLTDPPYGIMWKPRINHQDQTWIDDKPADMGYIKTLSPLLCVWGGNYYTDQLAPSESWLLWLKRPEGFECDPRTYSTCEMAWTNYGGKPKVKTFVWDGGKREGNPQNRLFCHPAQKPVEVMEWCLSLAPEPAQTILDPFLGSGTTAVAAKILGRKCIGIEISEKYCEIAVKRLAQSVMRLE